MSTQLSCCLLAAITAMGSLSIQAQTPTTDTIAPLTRELNPLIIEATRAHERVPVTFTDLHREDIAPLNSGQDLPYVLRFTPSLLVTSDAGNGIGYTGLWIRGSDPSRVNISINGIPLNDPESQQVFWVNTPDLASGSSSIQVQRGVGTSSNGAAAFGGLIKVDGTDLSKKAYGRVDNAVGSFNSRKHSLQWGTGLIGNRFIIEGRLSNISSDGYVDRARADLFGYSISGAMIGKRTDVLLTAFGGREETYQSWYGTPAEMIEGAGEDERRAFAERNFLTERQTENLLSSGRTYNYYTYDNQVDRYGQDHFQAHVKRRLGEALHLNLSGHYTRGKGYFEEYREEDSRSRYGLAPLVVPSAADTINRTDLIRRRWLDNHFYGAVFSLRYAHNRNLLTAGGAANEYRGTHFGELLWMQWAGDVPTGYRYYEGESVKRDGNMYVRYIHDLGSGWDAYGDLQLRAVRYTTQGIDNNLRNYAIDDQLVFFNPKAGVNKKISAGSRAYASVAIGNKEPNRNDYIDAPSGVTPLPERLTDVEAGFQAGNARRFFSANVYYMYYTDQLVLTGALNDVGAPLRTNVPVSYRAGIELEGHVQLNETFRFVSNLTLSENRIREFNEVIYDYTVDFEELSITHRNVPIAFSPRIMGMAGLQARFELGRTSGAEKEQSIRRSIECNWMQKGVGRQHLDNTGNTEVTIAPYTAADLLFSFVQSYPTGQEWRINLWVNNALDARFVSNGYTFSYIYDTRVTERFYYPQAGRNIMVGLNLLF